MKKPGRFTNSTRYLTKFTRAVSQVPGFATGQTEMVRVQSGAGDEQPVSILIPLRGLVAELDERMPLAEQARDLPRGRKRTGWKDELRAAFKQGAVDLESTSQADVATTLKSYRRERRKPELTVSPKRWKQPPRGVVDPSVVVYFERT